MEERSGNHPGRGTTWLTAGVLLGLAVVFGVVGGRSDRSAPLRASASAPMPGRLDVATTRLPASSRLFADRRLGGLAHGKPAPEPLLRPGDDRDYGTLSARLGSLVDKDNVATLLMREAAAACSRAPEPGWRNRVVKPRAVAFGTWQEGFCSRKVPQAELDSLNQEGKEAFDRRHPAWQGAGPHSTDQALDAVLSSDDVEVMAMASALLPTDGTNRWGLGRDLVQGSAYEADLHKYQRVAIEDMQCSATGGCGPGGMRSAMICLTSDGFECAPGQGAYDMWNEKLLPQEIDIVLAIEQRIGDERARRAAAP